MTDTPGTKKLQASLRAFGLIIKLFKSIFTIESVIANNFCKSGYRLLPVIVGPHCINSSPALTIQL